MKDLSTNQEKHAELQEMIDKIKSDSSIYLEKDNFLEMITYLSSIKPENDETEKDLLLIIDKALEKYPDEITFVSEKVHFLLSQQLVEQARDFMNAVTSSSSSQMMDTFELDILRASVSIAEGEAKEAQKRLEPYKDIDDFYSIIHIVYAFCNGGYFKEADKWLEKIPMKYHNDTDYLEAKVFCDTLANRHNSVVLSYNLLLDRDPYNINYWTEVAKSYYELKNYEKCIEACDFIITIDGQETIAYFLKSECYMRQEQYDKCIEIYQILLKLNRITSIEYNYFLALIYLELEKWQEALELFNTNLKQYLELPEVNPENFSLTCTFIGVCYYKIFDYSQAEYYFNEAHEISPDSCQCYIIEGKAYAGNKDYEKCLTAWNKAMELNPSPETYVDIFINSIVTNYFEMAYYTLNLLKAFDIPKLNINMKFCILALIMEDDALFEQHQALLSIPIDRSSIEEKIASDPQNDRLETLKKLILS